MIKGAIIITTVTDRVDSRFLPKWAELKNTKEINFQKFCVEITQKINQSYLKM